MINKIFLVTFVFLFTACDPGGDAAPTAEHSGQTTTNEYRDTDYIIGGRAVTNSDEVKATTAFIYDTNLRSLCTASILEKDILVTAAHCVPGKVDDIKIGFGLEMSSTELKPIQSIVIHPKWAEKGLDEKDTSDIAIIRFEGGLPRGYQPARRISARYKHKKDEVAVLAGYGVTSDVNRDRGGQLRVTEVKIKDPEFSETEILLDQTHGKGACYGDSGGPAFIKTKDDKLELWGVTSRGHGPSDQQCSGDSVYTKISSYTRWISSAITKLRK